MNRESLIEFHATAAKRFAVRGEKDDDEEFKQAASYHAATVAMLAATEMTPLPADRVAAPVTMPWTWYLPMQQQSVLLLAARGPDGVSKTHPCKDIVRAYRGTVLKAAYFGRALRWGERADGFMSLDLIADVGEWQVICEVFFDHVDSLPHHYYLHLAHGAQILGYKHPANFQRERWIRFYLDCCHNLHMNSESEAYMDARLSDWRREHWEE